MTDPAQRERAALDVLGLLPDRWAVGPKSYDPGTDRGAHVHGLGTPTTKPFTRELLLDGRPRTL